MCALGKYFFAYLEILRLFRMHLLKHLHYITDILHGSKKTINGKLWINPSFPKNIYLL